jgi:hypothetical protein
MPGGTGARLVRRQSHYLLILSIIDLILPYTLYGRYLHAPFLYGSRVITTRKRYRPRFYRTTFAELVLDSSDTDPERGSLLNMQRLILNAQQFLKLQCGNGESGHTRHLHILHA